MPLLVPVVHPASYTSFTQVLSYDPPATFVALSLCMESEQRTPDFLWLLRCWGPVVWCFQVEEERSQQLEIALEKDKMTAAFSTLKNLVEEDADTEAEHVKVMIICHDTVSFFFMVGSVYGLNSRYLAKQNLFLKYCNISSTNDAYKMLPMCAMLVGARPSHGMPPSKNKAWCCRRMLNSSPYPAHL